MGGTQLEQESWLEPYISPVPSAFQQPPSGGYGVNAGRMQQSCGNKAMRCKNHKVLNCMYGMCGTCCTGAARQPLCNIARHYKNNKYTWTSLIKNGFEQDSHQQKHPLKWVKTGWAVGEFVDVTKIWVNLFQFCWKWVKFDIFTHLFFQVVVFKELILPVSPICRFHQLVDFVFTYLIFPFHPLADFTNL